ncbi:hypothetical protein [Salinigranum sp. GCM10025319]|uniref:hypothetical protein n=1 Tax=Salinigranum sp. GCM10025319 TaxID=3252687 RepID=UPI00360E35CE
MEAANTPRNPSSVMIGALTTTSCRSVEGTDSGGGETYELRVRASAKYASSETFVPTVRRRTLSSICPPNATTVPLAATI